MSETGGSTRSESAQRIIEAAERLFGERGYEGVSIRDIAAAAGVSKANVFHHFASKWELYSAVVEGCSDSFRHLVEILQEPGRDSAALLGGFAREHLQRTLEQPCATRLFLRELIDTQDADGRALMERLVERNFRLAAEALTEFKARGRLAAHVDPQVLALVVLGGHLSYFLLRDVLPRLDGAALADPERYHRAMIELLLGGLLPPEQNE